MIPLFYRLTGSQKMAHYSNMAMNVRYLLLWISIKSLVTTQPFTRLQQIPTMSHRKMQL